MSDVVVIEGLDEAKKKLAQLTDAEMKKAERSGMLAGANVVAREGRRRAPRKTGRLAAKGLRVRTRVRAELARNQVEAQIGTNRVGMFNELGTRPHTIRARRGRLLRTEKGAVLGRRVRHPGMKARPWLRPAMQATGGEVAKAYGEAFKRRIARLTNG